MEERQPDSDREVVNDIGIPAEVLARLKPVEERLLRFVVANRDRIISDGELAEKVFEQPLATVTQEIKRSRFVVGMSVAKFGIMRAKFTYFRGEFTTGVRWTSKGE